MCDVVSTHRHIKTSHIRCLRRRRFFVVSTSCHSGGAPCVGPSSARESTAPCMFAASLVSRNAMVEVTKVYAWSSHGTRRICAHHRFASRSEPGATRLGVYRARAERLKSTSTLTEHLGVLTLASRFRCIVHSQHSHLTVSEVFSSDGEKDSPIIPQMLHSRA